MSLHIFAIQATSLTETLTTPISEFLRWLYNETDQTLCGLLEDQLSGTSGLSIDELERLNTPLSQLLEMYPDVTPNVLRAVCKRSYTVSDVPYVCYAIEQLTAHQATETDLPDLLLDNDFQYELCELCGALQSQQLAAANLPDTADILHLAEVIGTAHELRLQLVIYSGQRVYRR